VFAQRFIGFALVEIKPRLKFRRYPQQFTHKV
jgi:hypothetical protein